MVYYREILKVRSLAGDIRDKFEVLIFKVDLRRNKSDFKISE
jgi:hypothetical protein